MKKRILLILVIGVSFAPPVFANGKGLMDLKISHVGEQDEVSQGASFCAYDTALKNVNEELAKAEAQKTTAAIAH
jgi:hypothetical protein